LVLKVPELDNVLEMIVDDMVKGVQCAGYSSEVETAMELCGTGA
jgi:hypothetical protein